MAVQSRPVHPTASQSLALAFGIGSLVSVICMRLGIPAILPLLVVGLGLGKTGLVESANLGPGFGGLITVAIGILIFEGGLHLNRNELRKTPRAVWGLLTVGALTGWASTAVLAHYILGLSWSVSLLLGSILMVTGPTVIQPILRRVRLTPNLHTALGAEAVLIDPIGVIAAVSMLDLTLALVQGEPVESVGSNIIRYSWPLVGGAVVGAVVGAAAWLVLRSAPGRRMASMQLNLTTMAACTLAVGFGEWAAPESGLVAVTVCAVIVANAKIAGASEMRQFHEGISVILVGALFILLVSQLDFDRLIDVGTRDALFVGGLVLVVRPLCVLAGTLGSRLTMRERLFASLTAPRGIVAASVATLAAKALINVAGTEPDSASAALAGLEVEGLLLQETIFRVIVVTVTIAGVGALPLARLLGVHRGLPSGVLVIGAHALGRQFAQVLKHHKIEVKLVDINPSRIAAATEAGLEAFHGDATDMWWLEDDVLTPDIGWVLAWTGNDDVDRVVCRWGIERLKTGRAVLWRGKNATPAEASIGAIGDQQSLHALVGQIERGERRVAMWGLGEKDGVELMILSNGQLHRPDLFDRAKKANGAMVIGIA